MKMIAQGIVAFRRHCLESPGGPVKAVYIKKGLAKSLVIFSPKSSELEFSKRFRVKLLPLIYFFLIALCTVCNEVEYPA